MGKASGSKQQAAAANPDFATEAKPLTPVLKCKKGKTLLKVHLLRLDNDAIVSGEKVTATKGSSAQSKPTAGTGIADFGEIDPGKYSFGVNLSANRAKMFKAYVAKTEKVPKNVEFHATLKIAPIHKVRIVLIDKANKKISGANWRVTMPSPASGTTGSSGLIEFEIPWSETDGTISVKLPAGTKEPAATAVAAKDLTNPAYPLVVDEKEFLPKVEKSKGPLTDIDISFSVKFITDADDKEGWSDRLSNVGFPTTRPKSTTRSVSRTKRAVKAFQRLHKKEYTGSGKLDDISGDLKTLHDTV